MGLFVLNVVFLVRLRREGELPVRCHPLGLEGLEKADGAGETSLRLQELQPSWWVRIHLGFVLGALPLIIKPSL